MEATKVSVDRGKNKTWSLHMVKYYSALKRNSDTRYNMKLGDTMLSGSSQILRDKYCMIPL